MGWTDSDLGIVVGHGRDQMSALGLAHHVRVGNAERGENGAFEPFHVAASASGVVVVADEVQKAVHRKMAQMVAKGLPSSAASRFTVS